MKIAFSILNKIILIALPFVYLIGVILFVFQPWFLSFEYRRSNFPSDLYGFSDSERFDYGARSIIYITTLPESSLEAIVDRDDAAIYQESEIAHMADVRRVFQTARWGFLIIVAIIILAFAFGWRRPAALQATFTTLKTGSLIALALYLGFTVIALTAFEPLFYRFHQLFFTEGSWLFHPSDTLIRLFPKQLWIDAFIIVGAVSGALAILFYSLFRLFGKHVQISSKTMKNSPQHRQQ